MTPSRQDTTHFPPGLIRRAAFLFFPVAAAFVGFIYFTYLVQAEQIVSSAVTNETLFLRNITKSLGVDLSSAVSDTRVLSKYAPLLRMNDTFSEDNRKSLAAAFRNFSLEKRTYDQIRFLDDNGMEIVRVNRTSDGSRIVSKNELQDKQDRYYFTETIPLARGEVYISPLDLNIENGSIEIPQKPTIRFATPVFNAQNEKIGVVVLNYLADMMLTKFRDLSVHSIGRMYLINSDGYWFIGPTPDEEWGFMFPSATKNTFQAAYPSAWAEMGTKDAGSVRTPDGIFLFIRFVPVSGGSPAWFAVSNIDDGALRALLAPLRRVSLLAGGLIAAVLLTGSLLVAQAQLRRRAAIAETMSLRERQHKEQFRTLADNISQHAWMADRRGSIYWYNKRWHDFIDADTDAIEEWGWREIVHPDHADRIAKSIGRCLESGEPWDDTFPMRDKDGGYRWFLARAIPIRDQDGNVLRWFGTNTDITDRMQLEINLSKSHHYINNIFDSMPSLIIGIDLQGRITHWNQAARKESGLSFDSVKGRQLEEVKPELARHPESIQLAIRERRPVVMEKQPCRANGETCFQNIMFYPLADDSVDGVVIRVDNVTEQVRMSEVLIQSEKMASMGTLAAGMAHEINNPLGGIVQAAQVLLKRFEPDAPGNLEAARECHCTVEGIQCYLNRRQAPKFLLMIQEEGARAAKIVRNMLDFSRKSGTTRTLANLNDLLDKSLDLASSDYDLKKKYDFRRVSIVKKYDLALPPTYCIASEIEQVLINLLRNSAQALAEQAPADREPTITLTTMRAGHSIRIVVMDNGPGMDEQTRRKIFDPFFTTKGPDAGTGLGLSVSYYIIANNHSGAISVESEPGEWTKFTIDLPIVTES